MYSPVDITNDVVAFFELVKVYAKNYQRIKEKNNKPMAWINDIVVEIPDAKRKMLEIFLWKTIW